MKFQDFATDYPKEFYEPRFEDDFIEAFKYLKEMAKHIPTNKKFSGKSGCFAKVANFVLEYTQSKNCCDFTIMYENQMVFKAFGNTVLPMYAARFGYFKLTEFIRTEGV